MKTERYGTGSISGVTDVEYLYTYEQPFSRSPLTALGT